MQYQLDLFEELNELKILEERDRQIQQEVTNVRKGVFGRLNKIYKWMLKQEELHDKYTAKITEYNKRLVEMEEEIKRLKKTISWMESVA